MIFVLVPSVLRQKMAGDGTMNEFPFPSHSNDDLEEGDPGSDSDYEIDTKKEVRNMTIRNTSLYTHFGFIHDRTE